jgi:hypothetical protein
MISWLRSYRLLLIGFFMVLAGVILPFLMVLRILESTFFLNFFSYTLSTLGVFLGIIGTAMYVRENRRK